MLTVYNSDWNNIDPKRLKAAASTKLLSLDPKTQTAVFEGSSPQPYTTTRSNCSCAHHRKTGEICKHMVRLAQELGILNVNEQGLSPEQQFRSDIDSLRDKIALASGYYYVFHAPIMGNDEYDSLKNRHNDLLRDSPSQNNPLYPLLPTFQEKTGAECTPPGSDFARKNLNVHSADYYANEFRMRNKEELSVQELEDVIFVQELSVKVALASAFYHVYDLPIISDRAYDLLNLQLWNSAGCAPEKKTVPDSHYAAGSYKKLSEMSLNEYIQRAANIAVPSVFSVSIIDSEITSPQPKPEPKPESEPEPAPDESISFVLNYLNQRALEYVDKTGNGGGLYFFDESAADHMKAHGISVSFAAGGTRSTRHRPAWFVRAPRA